MSIIYLLCLSAVCIALLAAMYEAIAAVSRKPVWHEARMPTLTLIETVDRRSSDPSPFVGADRRQDELAADSHAEGARNDERMAVAA